MTVQQLDDARITERAAEWLIVLADGGAQEQEAFAQWLRESARHVEEFLFVSSLMSSYSRFDSRRQIDLDALLAQIPTNVVSLLPEGLSTEDGTARPAAARPADAHQLGMTAAGTTWRKKWWGVGLAAGLSSLVVAGVVFTTAGTLSANAGWQKYSTTLGEVRSFELPDGSTVHLNTESSVKVKFGNGVRNIQLVAGEASFKVARRVNEPFRVEAGKTLIEAVGTEFNVYRREHDTEVSVLEGAVKVARADSKTPEKGATVPAIRGPKLTAGQQAIIEPNGEVKVKSVDAARATAWRQRRLVFLNDKLADVALEFNRYNRTPQIVVENGGGAGTQEITGVFDADDPESLIDFLVKDDSLQFDTKTDRIVIRSRP